jgi:CRP-like cAMP-binding protein
MRLQSIMQSTKKTLKRNEYVQIDQSIRIISGYGITKISTSDGSYQANGVFGSGCVIAPEFCPDSENYFFKTLTEVEIEYLGHDWKASPKDWRPVVFSNFLARHKTAQEKLFLLFNYFKHNYSQNNVLSFSINHDDLSELIDSTRVTVTRIMGKLEQQGFIHKIGRNIEFKK